MDLIITYIQLHNLPSFLSQLQHVKVGDFGKNLPVEKFKSRMSSKPNNELVFTTAVHMFTSYCLSWPSAHSSFKKCQDFAGFLCPY